MKIAKNGDSFQPFTLEITVESKKELEILYEIARANLRIPDALYKRDSKEWREIQSFLVQLNGALNGQT